MKHLRVLAACALVPGCMQPGPVHEPELEAGVLSWLVDGVTTKDDALLTLGDPSARYLDGTILAWRLGRNKYGELAGFAPEFDSRGHRVWDVAQYSLVLVFDKSCVLARHRLLRI